MTDSALIFLDLETTGTRTTRDRITEIAALKLVGGEVVSRYTTLVDPGVSIPEPIRNITGITDAMVNGQPTFEEVANELFVWLGDGRLVAHNARFDYGFLRNEFKRAGLEYQAKVVCTLKLSRRLTPQEAQHNLDALLLRHDLTNASRHRALGDAEALLALWKRWHVEHDPAAIETAVAEQLRRESWPAHLDPGALDGLPQRPGVYLFYGYNRLPLYVGKSVNLRSRVLSHFSNDHRDDREMRLKAQLQGLEWHETAGDLGAQLLEARLVKELMPIHNRQLRRRGRLISWLWREGETTPQLLEQAHSRSQHDALYGLFRNRRDAQKALLAIAEQERLCPRILGLEKGVGRCFAHQLGRCRGACCGKETLATHTRRAQEALERIRIQHWPWPGRVAFREAGPEGVVAFHLVDHWHYYGSVTHLDEVSSLPMGGAAFDVDTYKILNRFLADQRQNIQPIPLD
ncbi:exonuclease domain-containing protein [Halomonas sp. WWR20]